MNNALTLKIGKTSFNSTLLTDINDGVDITIENVYVTDTAIFQDEFFDLLIDVKNSSIVSKDVKLKIYTDEDSYSGYTSEVTIVSDSTYTFIYNNKLSNVGDHQIRIELYIMGLNYVSRNFTVTIHSVPVTYTRVLTSGDVRTLTDGDTRVVVI